MRLQGYVREILIDRIHVPLSMGIPLRTFLGDAGKRAEGKERPHYRVTVRYGKRYEPWIVDINLSKE